MTRRDRHNVVQNSQKWCRFYAACSSVRLFDRTAHSFACSTLLTSLARSDALICSLAHSITPKLMGKERLDVSESGCSEPRFFPTPAMALSCVCQAVCDEHAVSRTRDTYTYTPCYSHLAFLTKSWRRVVHTNTTLMDHSILCLYSKAGVKKDQCAFTTPLLLLHLLPVLHHSHFSNLKEKRKWNAKTKRKKKK